ncbi:MAG: DNA methyltransferase [Candidatus Aenigmatarchaeota archaeon]
MIIYEFFNKLKFPDDFVNKIICGDCLELIKKIPNNSIDMILTDPPYGLNKKGVYNDVDLGIFYKSLPEFHRVLKEDSWFVAFFSTKFLPYIFKNNPFTYFWQVVLYCPEGMVKSPIGITKFMSCFIFKKGNPKLVQRNKDIFIDTPGKMIEPDEGFINHPTPKPKHFIKEILRMLSKEGDLILDPFIGSGSTAIACKQLGRNFIGFEINQNYVKIANNRLKNIGGRLNDR